MGFLNSILPIAIGAGAFALSFAIPSAGFAIGSLAISQGVAQGAVLLLGGLAASFASQALAPDLPAIKNANAKALENAADPEYSRRIIYGETMAGYSWAFDNVGVPEGPDDGAHYRLTGIIADRKIEAFLGVEIDDAYMEFGKHLVPNVFFNGVNVSSYWGLPTTGAVYIPVPHSDWNQDFSETGRYLMTSAGRVYEVVSGGVVDVVEATDTSGNNFVSGTATLRWHMNWDPADDDGPSQGYHAEYEGERDGPPVWHFAIDPVRGNQTTRNAWFNGLIPEYAERNRIFRGLAFFNAIFVANPTLALGGNAPQLRFRVQGTSDIWDPRSGSNVYTNNAILVAVDYLKWRLGFTNADFLDSNIIAMADACDVVVPGQTYPRYTFDGVIEWETDPIQVLTMLARHFAGGWFWRGNKLLFWVGQSRATVMNLAVEDLLPGQQPVYHFRRPNPEDRCNEVVVHSIQRLDADGNQVWQPRPSKALTDAAWKANDNGAVLRHDLEFPGIVRMPQAKLLGWFYANQARLETQLIAAFDVKALPLELGDTVTWTDSENGFVFFEMWVVDKVTAEEPYPHVALLLREHASSIYTPGAIEDEDLGKFPKKYRKKILRPTGISVTNIPNSAELQADGSVKVGVRVSWTAVENVWVQAGGSYRVRYRENGSGDSWRGVNADGQTTGVEIKLTPGVWDFQVRAISQFTRSKWGPKNPHTVVVIAAHDRMQGPPTRAARGINLIANPLFEQRALSWNTETGLTWVTPTAPVVGNLADLGPYVARLDTAAANGDVDLKQSVRIPIDQPGMIYKANCWVHNLGNSDTEDAWKVLFYDGDDVYLSGRDILLRTIVGQGGLGSQQQYITEYFQAPRGIGARSFRLELKAREGPGVQDHVTECAGMKCWEHGSFPAARKDTTSITGTGVEKLIGMRFPQGLTRPPDGSKWLVEASAHCVADATQLTVNDLTVTAQIVRVQVSNSNTVVIKGPITVGFAAQGAVQIPPSFFELTVEDDPAIGGGETFIYRLQADTDRSLGAATFEQVVMKVKMAGDGSTPEGGETG